jgi:hypothetical protein
MDHSPEEFMAYDPEYHRQYYLANKAKKREQAAAWAARNPEKIKASARKQSARRNALGLNVAVRKKWEANNRAYILWNAAKQRAKKSGIPFEIAVEDVIIPERCPIFGFEINTSERARMHPRSPSLDRIVPGKGYVSGNVWVISWQANRMKSDATPEQLRQFCEGVLRLLPST